MVRERGRAWREGGGMERKEGVREEGGGGEREGREGRETEGGREGGRERVSK